MKQLADYLEQTIRFEAMAARELNPKLRSRYQEQADTYRLLADKLATDLGLRIPALAD
jgi:hypothetical protein